MAGIIEPCSIEHCGIFIASHANIAMFRKSSHDDRRWSNIRRRMSPLIGSVVCACRLLGMALLTRSLAVAFEFLLVANIACYLDSSSLTAISRVVGNSRPSITWAVLLYMTMEHIRSLKVITTVATGETPVTRVFSRLDEQVREAWASIRDTICLCRCSTLANICPQIGHFGT